MDSIIEILWSDNSGDKIYLSLNGDSVDISSDPNNTGEERVKTITFTTTNSSPATADLQITQEAKGLIVITYNNEVPTYNNIVPSYPNNTQS